MSEGSSICGRFITVISVYVLNLGSSQESMMAFYQDLCSCIISIPNVHKILLLGDLNARVGGDRENWNALGQHGIGEMNSNARLLRQTVHRVLFLPAKDHAQGNIDTSKIKVWTHWIISSLEIEISQMILLRG